MRGILLWIEWEVFHISIYTGKIFLDFFKTDSTYKHLDVVTESVSVVCYLQMATVTHVGNL